MIDAIATVKPLLEVNVTSVLVYFADGHSLTLPIATRIPKGGFRKPHWVPVVLKRRREADVRATPRK